MELGTQPAGAGRNRIGSKVERPLTTLYGLMWGKVVFPTPVLNYLGIHTMTVDPTLKQSTNNSQNGSQT